MTTLYRAANDDYVDSGYAFAEEIETARMYLDNPGFGGANIYRCKARGKVLDLTGMTMAEAAAELDMEDPGAIGVDEWIPRTVDALETAQARGYSWIKVDESYPRGTTTWIWCGDVDSEPELTEVAS